MKVILISIKPKWCALMMNGDKTVEVRVGTALYKATKKLIDEYGFAEFFVCCTKGDYDIVRESSPYSSVPYYTCVKIDKKLSKDLPEYKYSCRGKVIFKFRCYKVEELKTCERHSAELIGQSCLSANEFYDYLTKGKNFLGQVLGCAIHISDLEIFDKPKELCEVRRCSLGFNCEPSECLDCPHRRTAKAPQSFCYVEVE